MPDLNAPPPRRMAEYLWFRVPGRVEGLPAPHFLGRGRDPARRYRTDRVRQAHMPGRLVLSVALSGGGRARVGGREHALGPGGACFHGVNDEEDWFGSEAGAPGAPGATPAAGATAASGGGGGGGFDWIGFIFEGRQALAMAADLRARFPGPYRLDPQSATIRRLVALTKERTHQVTMPASEGVLLVCEVLAMVLGAAQAGVRAPQTRQLARDAEALMAERPEKDWTVGELAGACGVSREHLSRAFTQRFGVAPRRYLSELRIQKACARLRGTDVPIKNIVLDLGFKNHATFTRAFRRYTHTTPSAYRANRPV